jgi:hypothetical protein
MQTRAAPPASDPGRSLAFAFIVRLEWAQAPKRKVENERSQQKSKAVLSRFDSGLPQAVTLDGIATAAEEIKGKVTGVF